MPTQSNYPTYYPYICNGPTKKRVFYHPDWKMYGSYWIWDEEVERGYWSRFPNGNGIVAWSDFSVEDMQSYGGMEILPLPEHLQLDEGL